MSARGDEGLFLGCLRSLDEVVNVKQLLRLWGPRFEFVVRLILVATFLDDSLRAVTHFTEHVKQVSEQGYLAPLAETSPGLVGVIALVALAIGLQAQLIGSFCLLTLQHYDNATKALIGWAIAQPVLYAQLANLEFVAESLSLIGGLLILRAHLSEQDQYKERRAPLGGGALCAPFGMSESVAHTQLVGRLLLPAVYMYHAFVILIDNLTGAVDHSEYTFAMLATEYAVNLAVLAALVAVCALIAAGLRSRTVALVLALVSVVIVFWRNPFFRYVWIEDGKWKYDKFELRRSIPYVSLPKDAAPGDLEPWHIVDLHRYYFFLGLSTTGALLLLAQFGPGELALEEDEVILGDVQRARDYRQVSQSLSP